MSMDKTGSVILHCEYYVGIIKLKKAFITNLTRYCDRKRETYKIWAQWLIRTLSNPNYDGYALLRKVNLGTTDPEIIKHMEQNGVSTAIANSIYRELIDGYSRLVSLYLDSHYQLFQQVDKLQEFQTLISLNFANRDPFYLSLNDTNISIKIYGDKFQRLKKLYIGPSELFLAYLFETVFNYHMLDGKGLQWSLPPPLFEGLSKFDLKGELFASPMNHYCQNYYSLFESDQYFRSKGNLFSRKSLISTTPLSFIINNTSVIENDVVSDNIGEVTAVNNLSSKLIVDLQSEASSQLQPGLYEVNPPFIEEIFSKSAELICGLMSQTDQPYGFVYIMPNWTDFDAYQYLSESPFFCQKIVMPANRHYYFEWNSQKYILATFETIVMILANQAFQSSYSISDIGQVIKSWGSPR